MILPIVKTGGKALLREGALTGLQVAQDALEGRNVKEAFKEHARDAGKRLLHGAVGHLAGNQSGSGLFPPGEPARKRIKLGARRRVSQSKKRRQASQKKNKKSDIFG